MPERDLIKWLAIACMATAFICGAVMGIWEHMHPFFGHARYQVIATPAQRWTYAIAQAFKAFGYFSGLVGFFLVATRRGLLVKIVLAAAALGATFYAIVWIAIAVTARDDAVYVRKYAIGSDMHSNGGALFLWLAPVTLGIAALVVHRIARWKSIWAIIVSVVGLRIFGLLPPGAALLVEGFLWLVLGWIVYISRNGADNFVGPERRGRVL